MRLLYISGALLLKFFKKSKNKDKTEIEKDNNNSDKLAEILSFPQGTFKNFPSIQIRGNREIIIDGCTGLLLYEQDIILLETKYCRISINGRTLTLNNLTKNILAVRGFIKNVEFTM